MRNRRLIFGFGLRLPRFREVRHVYAAWESVNVGVLATLGLV
jgi:hypothetical protein